MKKYLVLFFISYASFSFADSHSVGQSIVFSGFPYGTDYYPSEPETKINEGGGSAAVVMNNSGILPSFPSVFPPIDPIDDSSQQYNAICDIGVNGNCSVTFKYKINYYPSKSCQVSFKLSIDVEPGIDFDGSTKHHHSASVSGDCSIKGGEGDQLWIVSPTAVTN